MSNSPNVPEGYEPSPVGSRDRTSRSLFAGVPIIIVLVIGAVLVVLLILNTRFMASVNECRAIQYPGATVIDEQQPYFLQPFGQLSQTLHTPDAPDVVTAWYTNYFVSAQREAIVSGDFTQNTPSPNWMVGTAEGGGSEILLVCP